MRIGTSEVVPVASKDRVEHMTRPRTPFLSGAVAWLYDGDEPDVCGECAFDWGMSFEAALLLVKTSPGRYEAWLVGADGMAPRPDGSWNATAYVWHLVDFSRSWTERWYQIIDEPGSTLIGWDPDELADLRGYRSLPTGAALRALRPAVTHLVDATTEAGPDAGFNHGDWGSGDVGDATIWIAHEFHHHERDVMQRTG